MICDCNNTSPYDVPDFDLGGTWIPNNNSEWGGGEGRGGYGGFGAWGQRGFSRNQGGYMGFNNAYFGMGNYGSIWPYYSANPSINVPYFFDADEDWE